MNGGRRYVRSSSRRWVSPAPTRERSAAGWRSATASPPAALTMLTSSSALVAEDGSKASVHNDRPRAQRAARELEERFGLRQLEARARGTGSRGIRPGERMADTRRKRDHGPRGSLTRAWVSSDARADRARLRDRQPQRERVHTRAARARRPGATTVRRGRPEQAWSVTRSACPGPTAVPIGRCGSAAGAWRAI